MTLLESDQYSAWQTILDHLFQSCIAFCYPEIDKKIDWSKGYELLDHELQSITFDGITEKGIASKLIKITWRDGQTGIILLYVATERDVSDRLLQYHCQIENLCGQRIVPLVILADDDPHWDPKPHDVMRSF
jgi:hypothetical protein